LKVSDACPIEEASMGQSKRDLSKQRKEVWRRHIAECRESGLSYAEYARRHELKESAFCYWRQRLSGSSGQKPAFVELKVSESRTSGIEIIFGNQMRVSLSSDFDEKVLERLIGMLGSV
tara:strand:- start:152 stop:508 length:357 start_codon:yes stop_codon:yes gene_type:complete